MKKRHLIHPVTGQELIFLKTAEDTNGQLLEMEARYRARSPEPPPHYHPCQRETFTVLEGEMMVRMNGAVRPLRAGEVLVIEPNTVHSMWNATRQTTRMNWKTEPALQTEDFFRTFFGLATAGKTKPNGAPDRLQIALLMQRFVNEFRLAKPAFAIQRILFGVLALVARWKGLKSSYPEYEE